MKGPIARGTIRTSFVLGLRLVVQAGTLLLVARMLGPQQFGAFAGVAALALILGALSTFGTHLVFLGEVSKDPSQRRNVLRFALPTTLLCGSVLLAAYFGLSHLILGKAGLPFSSLLAIGLAELFLQPLITLLSAEYLALGRIARSQLIQTLAPVFRLFAAGAIELLHLPNPFSIYVMAYLAASLVALGIVLILHPAPLPGLRSFRLPNWPEVKGASGYAVINITKASPAELDKTLALRLLPLDTAGVYAAGARVVGATTMPIIAMALSALPRLFRDGALQPARTGRLLIWMFSAAALYGVMLAACLWLAAPLFKWLFGAKFSGIDTILRWLCIAIPGMSLRLTAGNSLMALGQPWMRVGFEVTGVVILVVASVMLTSSMGAIGMALALATSEWVMAIVGGLLVIASRRGRKNSGKYTERQIT